MEKWKHELEETLAEVRRRSAVDPDFRASAIKDGVAAMARVNPRLPLNGLVFKFVDNSSTTRTIVLPDLIPDIEEKELSETDLESVTGGTDSPPPPTTVIGG